MEGAAEKLNFLQDAVDDFITLIPASEKQTAVKSINFIMNFINETDSFDDALKVIAGELIAKLKAIEGGKSSSIEVISAVDRFVTIFYMPPWNGSNVDAALEDIFAAKNAEMQAGIKKFAEVLAVGNVIMDRLSPEGMKKMATISGIISHVKFDFDLATFDPAFILEMRSTPENLLVIHDHLTNINRIILNKQEKFHNKNVLEYLVTKVCQSVENLSYNCSFVNCKEEKMDKQWNYLKMAQEMGYEWMKILKVVTCQHEVETFAEKLECVVNNPTHIRLEILKNKFLKKQKNVFTAVKKRVFDKRHSCECQSGEFPKFQANMSEMHCRKCLVGTYNLEIGTTSCKKCPELLLPNEPFFQQCSNSKFTMMQETIELQKKLIQRLEADKTEEIKQLEEKLETNLVEKNDQIKKLGEKLEMQSKEIANLDTKFTKDETIDSNFVFGTDWIKIQRRGMGSYFPSVHGSKFSSNTKWVDYVNGFGTHDSDEFWLGLKMMHNLTKNGRWELMFKAKWDWRNTGSSYKGYWSYMIYPNFQISSASDLYRINVGTWKAHSYVNNYDSFNNYGFNGETFSTSDHNPSRSCSSSGAWWFGSKCNHACFNCNAVIGFMLTQQKC